jgi:hypothetical protein
MFEKWEVPDNMPIPNTIWVFQITDFFLPTS